MDNLQSVNNNVTTYTIAASFEDTVTQPLARAPTYFGNVAWQVKKLIDESIELYRKGHALRDKVGGCFTSAGTHRDGKSCIRLLEVTFGFHHRMKIVPGIISTSGDEETQVSKMCQQYGEEIAKQILS